MAEVVTMIQLSPTMEEGLVVGWSKKEGDDVEAGEILAEVETDKAAMEMESFFDGVLLKVLVAAGDSIKVGAPMAIIGDRGEDIAEVLAGLESAPAPVAATAGENEPSKGGSTAVASWNDADAPAAANAIGARSDGRVLSSPLARKLASEAGIPISAISGSGPGGRVVKRDVLAAKEAGVTGAASGRDAAIIPVVATAEDRVVSLSPMRKAIARNLSTAWQAPAFMLTRDFDMANVVVLRKQINDGFKTAGVDNKVSFNDFIIKACARALIDTPDMNVAYGGDHLTMFGSADIGIAVAIDGGLITPVIRAAHTKALSVVSSEARTLAGRAREKKLKPEEYSGATFSISNLGMFGIDHFTAVLNPPAAGILAVGNLRKTPVVAEDGSLVAGTRMSVTLTCDHRAVDGATGARFLQQVAIYLENPALMLA